MERTQFSALDLKLQKNKERVTWATETTQRKQWWKLLLWRVMVFIFIFITTLFWVYEQRTREPTLICLTKKHFFLIWKRIIIWIWTCFGFGSTRPKYLLKNMHTEESYRFTRFTINERFRWKTKNVRILFILIFSCVRSHCSYHEPSPLPLLVHR